MSTNTLKGDPEVTDKGIKPKSKRGSAKPTVTVTHKTERKGKLWLRNFVAGVLIADGTWGMVGIREYFDNPEDAVLMANALWLWGLVHGAAVLAVLFAKWE